MKNQIETGSAPPAAIVGAGAAGLMAAARGAERGRSILLLERNDAPGRKLKITGKGRCNITNLCSRDEFLANVPRNPKFLYGAYDAFPPEAVMSYFESLGVPLKVERGRRVFPVSDRAADLVDALVRRCLSLGVVFEKATVTGLVITQGVITAVQAGDRQIPVSSVLLATGGLSYPATGSTGLGYDLARQAGHTITELSPSLVPLVSSDRFCPQLMGLSLRNVRLTACNSKKNQLFEDFGELLFTHFGLSGPLILSASAHLRGEYPVELRIDCKPALEESQLEDRLLRDFAERQNQAVHNGLGGLLPRLLIPVLLNLCGIPKDTPVHSVTKERRRLLRSFIKSFPVTVTGPRPIEEAVITSGGVNLREIHPKTMASKRIPNLHFAGEILDVDAYTGGYNLQIAWATAAAAAAAIDN